MGHGALFHPPRTQKGLPMSSTPPVLDTLSFHLSTPVASAFAEREAMPALQELMNKAHTLEMTTAEFIDALINVQAETLISLLGPQAAGTLLQDLGRHVIQRQKS